MLPAGGRGDLRIRGVKAPIHRHRYDLAGVYLRYGDITVTTPDGTATSGQKFEVPRPYFQLKNITHREEAMGKPGDPERLARRVHQSDTIEVFVTGGRIRTTTADGTQETHEVAFKTARWVPRGRRDREEAVAGSPRAIIVELK